MHAADDWCVETRGGAAKREALGRERLLRIEREVPREMKRACHGEIFSMI
jgi:hypothetical protein